MRISESATQEWTLASIPAGETVEVIEIRAEQPEQLLVHGLRPGARLVVEADAPFGGPRVVRLGRARVAIDRRLAAAVRVAPADVP
jgi:Fe2+ transport system protein FeoA